MATISNINGYNLKDKISGYTKSLKVPITSSGSSYSTTVSFNTIKDAYNNGYFIYASYGDDIYSFTSIDEGTNGECYFEKYSVDGVDYFKLTSQNTLTHGNYFPSSSVSDVRVNNTSVVSSGIANIVTNTPYNATNNKIATMSDVAIGSNGGTINGTLTIASSGALSSNGPITANGAINAVGDINLTTSGTSSDDSADLVWKYGDGTEKMRIYSSNNPTVKQGPNFRIRSKSAGSSTFMYEGTLPLGDGTGASGTWGIDISGNAATATNATNATNALYLTGVENTNPSSTTTYYPLYSAGLQTGTQYTPRGSTNYVIQVAPTTFELFLGESNSKKGFLRFCESGSNYVAQITTSTLTATRWINLPNASGTVLLQAANNYVQLYSGTLSSGSTTFTGSGYSAYLIVGAEARGYRSSITVPRSLITTTEEQWMVTFYGDSSIENVRFGLQATAATGGTITITWKSGKTITQIYGIK